MPVLAQAVITTSDAIKIAFLPAPPQANDPAQRGGHPPSNVPTAQGIPPPPGDLVGDGLRPDFKNRFFERVYDLLHGKFLLEGNNDPATMDYGGWFNYYFAEAKDFAAGNEEQLGRIIAVLVDLDAVLERSGAVYIRHHTAPEILPLSAAFLTLKQSAPGAVPLGVLKFLLELGFSKPATTSADQVRLDRGAGQDRVTSEFSSYVGLTSSVPDFALQCAMNTPPAQRSASQGYVFSYRGDSRDPGTVVRQNGAICRADLDFWRDNTGVSEAWHPWSDATERNEMWIRKGNRDNDYFTVNSIAMDFHIACAYPIFRSVEIVGPKVLGNVNNWTDDERRTLNRSGKAKICTITRNGVEGLVIYDTTRIYVCLIPDNSIVSKTFDTGAEYPESGIRNVPLDTMVACITVKRFHRGPDQITGLDNRRAGVYSSTEYDPSMTVQVRDWQFVHGAQTAQNIVGLTEQGVQLLEARLNSLRGSVFDISHTRFKGTANTYWNVASARPGFPRVAGPSTVKTTNR